MPMHKVAPGVEKSIYPLEYNKNNPTEGFNEWAEYIRKENLKNSYVGYQILISFNFKLVQRVLDEKKMNRVLGQANQILNTSK